MLILVAYASKQGATRGIAERSTEEWRRQGMRLLRHGCVMLSRLRPAPDPGRCGPVSSWRYRKSDPHYMTAQGDGQGREVPVVETSAVLASAGDRVVGQAVAALERCHQAHYQISSLEERRRYVRNLFELVVQCVREADAGPIIASCQQIAADRFEAGFDIVEIQETLNVLEEVLRRHVADSLPVTSGSRRSGW